MNRPSTILGHIHPIGLAGAIGSMMDTFHDDIPDDQKAELVVEITDSLEILFNNVGYDRGEQMVEEADMFPINHRNTWRNFMKKIDMRR